MARSNNTPVIPILPPQPGAGNLPTQGRPTAPVMSNPAIDPANMLGLQYLANGDVADPKLPPPPIQTRPLDTGPTGLPPVTQSSQAQANSTGGQSGGYAGLANLSPYNLAKIEATKSGTPMSWEQVAGQFGTGQAYDLQRPKDPTQRKVYDAALPTVNMLTSMGDQFGLSHDPAFRDLARQYQATIGIYQSAGDEEGAQEYSAQFVQQIPTVLTQLSAQKRMEDEAKAAAEQRMQRVLSLQSEFAPIFNNVAGYTASSNQMMYDQMVKNADQIATADPQLAASIRVNAAATRSSSDALLAAYANQMALTPAWVGEMMYSQPIAPPTDPSAGGGYQGLINAYNTVAQPLT